ncbi:ABC-2 type transporter-domain-containing protein [Phellopilus nigrolimitatus]|nr:ABC-2 type transporter-domain-containing protein [Phellopilus nigrolimitatus]
MDAPRETEPPPGDRDRDVVPELPAGPAMAAAAIGDAFHHHGADDGDEKPAGGGLKKRRGSAANSSRVALDHFDPEGVHELKRTLTQQSAAARSMHSLHPAPVPPLPGQISSAQSTLGSTVVSDAEQEKFDLGKHLKDIVKRQEEQSITPRELGVVFKDLRVQGLGSAASYQPTVGSMFNPLLIPEKIRQAIHPPVRDILSGFEGVVNPGEMLLVLGRPGAGCSTLLKTLANQHAEYHAVSGLLHYSAFTPKQVYKHFRGDVIYCPEDDVHFPTLTVQETLSFAARTRMPRRDARLAGCSRAEFVDSITGTLSTVFGLRHVRHTKVGNAAIRGVSGGERKRVSIAEALASRAKLGAWDNSTRGLDASTALEFVRALRIATDNLGLTSIVSIYQASELLYELFDKVCVINEGRMVYFGSAGKARQYFIDMGWEPANRQTTADFLVAVTDANGRTARAGFGARVPRTADEMAAHFQTHALADANRADVAAFLAANVITEDRGAHDALAGAPVPAPAPASTKEEKRRSYIESAQAERARHTRAGSPFTISVAMQVQEAMVRRVQILKGDWTAQVIIVASYVFQAIIMGTIFLKTPDSTSAYFSRGGVLFFAILFGALSAMAEIPALFAQRPIVNRHYKAAMYHPFAESIALTIVDIPITFVTIAVFSVILYFLVKLQQTAGQFFIFFLLAFSVTITMRAFFRALAAAFKREPSAQALAGIFILALVLYTGYTIPKPSMIGALRWITYINPLRYGFEAILVNEFHTLDGTCATLVPQGPGYENISLANQVCTSVGSVAGQSTVNGNTFVELSYGYSYSHLWMNFGIVCAFAAGFIFFLNLFTELNTTSAADAAVTLYKRGAKAAPVSDAASAADDEEKGSAAAARAASDASPEKSETALEASPVMTDFFTWQHLNYTVPVGRGETRLLLDDVSGYVAPGKLTALMGESGAGKTTLLNVLAGRTDTGVITGDRLVNGYELPRDFQAQTGYCQQMDSHLPETTVREALLFSAKLRQPQSVPLAEKEAYVETCLRMCGLEAHADAIVGSLGVEHKKRTTIGVELAAKPRLLLFLDEPTSGLDSQSAWAITAFLRSLADHGQAILCTIHQPSSELFQVFDRLLLLRKGGQTVYFGDLGKNSSTIIGYFEKNGARPCEQRENPAEWMLDVIGAGATATATIDWHSAWLKSEEATRMKEQIDQIHEEGHEKPPIQTTRQSEFATSWGYQLLALTSRAFQAYWRNPTYVMSKLFLNIAAGLFIGFTFFKAKDSLQGSQNKLFAIFMASILSVPLSNQLQVIFIDFRNIYEVRERPSRMYSWTSLLAAQLIAEIPWNILGSSLFFLCWYWTVGFDSSRAGFTYFMFGLAFPMYYTTFGMAVAAMAPDAVIASVLFSALFSFVIAFNGVLQPFRQLGWWQWMYRLSPYTYLIEGILGQAIGRQQISCSSTEFVTVDPPSGQTCSAFMDPFISTGGGYVDNPDATSACKYCSARTTDEFLSTSFNIFYSHHWRNLGIVFGFAVFNVGLLFAFMYLFRIRSRR